MVEGTTIIGGVYLTITRSFQMERCAISRIGYNKNCFFRRGELRGREGLLYYSSWFAVVHMAIEEYSGGDGDDREMVRSSMNPNTPAFVLRISLSPPLIQLLF